MKVSIGRECVCWINVDRHRNWWWALGNETAGSIQDEEFLDQLRNH
jgi:hypothetical protein